MKVNSSEVDMKEQNIDSVKESLLSRYKRLLKSLGLSNEKYKWEFLRDYKSKPDLKYFSE